jgi:hypothetical protein
MINNNFLFQICLPLNRFAIETNFKKIITNLFYFHYPLNLKDNYHNNNKLKKNIIRSNQDSSSSSSDDAQILR